MSVAFNWEGLLTYSSKIHDELDELAPNVIGNTIKEEDHTREPRPVLFLPAKEVPFLDSLILRGLGRGSGGGSGDDRFGDPGTLDVNHGSRPRG